MLVAHAGLEVELPLSCALLNVALPAPVAVLSDAALGAYSPGARASGSSRCSPTCCRTSEDKCPS
eukprot:3418932-Pyramimonas_sp.AAC.1